MLCGNYALWLFIYIYFNNITSPLCATVWFLLSAKYLCSYTDIKTIIPALSDNLCPKTFYNIIFHWHRKREKFFVITQNEVCTSWYAGAQWQRRVQEQNGEALMGKSQRKIWERRRERMKRGVEEAKLNHDVAIRGSTVAVIKQKIYGSMFIYIFLLIFINRTSWITSFFCETHV